MIYADFSSFLSVRSRDINVLPFLEAFQNPPRTLNPTAEAIFEAFQKPETLL